MNIIRCKRYNFIGLFGQIIELYKYSENNLLQRKRIIEKGIASIYLSSDSQKLEEHKIKLNLNQ